MKRIVLIWMAALMMGGMAMAQDARRSDKKPDPKVHAERMTERMAKEYSLDDAQKKQLLEANLALTEKMGDMPMRRRPDMRKGRRRNASCCCCCDHADRHHAKADRHEHRNGRHHQLTDEQRAQKKEELEKKREEMKAARADYDAKLQKIMTNEQYAAYNKKKDRRER